MTIFKYIVGRRYGWARTPLTSLLLREGIAVCLLIFGELILVPICGHSSEGRGSVVIVVNVAYDSTPSFELVAEIWDAAFAYVLLFPKVNYSQKHHLHLSDGIYLYCP